MTRSVIDETKKADYHRAQTGAVATELISGEKAIYVADKRIIRDQDVSDEEGLTEEQKEQRKKQKAQQNDRYYMGYFKWKWSQCNSFFLTYMHFSGHTFWYKLRWAFFSGIGLAIGSFLAIQFIAPLEWLTVGGINFK